MNKFLIDACVVHGWANVDDVNHSVCEKFFRDHMREELFFPIHSLFEVHASRSKRIRANTFSGLPGDFKLKNQKFIDINRKFYDKCQSQDLFNLFKCLRGSDLIYACIAKIGDFTLVTCDSDFDVYSGEIRLLNIKL